MGQTLSEPVVEKVSRPEIFQFAMICLPLPTLPWDASRMGFFRPSVTTLRPHLLL